MTVQDKCFNTEKQISAQQQKKLNFLTLSASNIFTQSCIHFITETCLLHVLGMKPYLIIFQKIQFCEILGTSDLLLLKEVSFLHTLPPYKTRQSWLTTSSRCARCARESILSRGTRLSRYTCRGSARCFTFASRKSLESTAIMMHEFSASLSSYTCDRCSCVPNSNTLVLYALQPRKLVQQLGNETTTALSVFSELLMLRNKNQCSPYSELIGARVR